MTDTLTAVETEPGRFGRFWRWWTDELRAVLPAKRRDPLIRRAVILLADEAGFRAIANRRNEIYELGRLELPRPSRVDLKRGVSEPRLVSDEHSTELAGRINRSKLPIVLRLPMGEGLVARDELPAAAERHLAEVLRHRVDVLTPWPADRVAFDACVNRRTEDGRIVVDATFAPLDTLGKTIGLLTSFELKPTIVDVAGQAVDALPRIDLLQGMNRPRSRLPMVIAGIVAAVLVMTGAGFAWQAWQRATLVDERLAQQAAIEARLQEADAREAHRQREAAARSFLATRRSELPSPLAALEIVARVLPDDVWLAQLELDRGRLTMTGEAPDAAAVLAQIGADGRFTDAALGSASTRQPSQAPDRQDVQVDRFTITANLKPGAVPTP